MSAGDARVMRGRAARRDPFHQGESRGATRGMVARRTRLRELMGGITGYASREVIATPETDVEIEAGQAFAWNPSITGAKSEETFVLTGDGAEVVAGAGIAVG